LAFSLVERLLGGNGLGTKQTNIITPIEQKILGVVVERAMEDLEKAWQAIDNFEFKLDRFEPDIDFAQITSPSESVLLISFEIGFGEMSYMMNICFATYAFDPILAKISSQKFSSIRPSKYKGTTSQEIIANKVYDAEVPVKIEFGKTKILLKELLALDKGDMLKLETKTSDEVVVKIDNREIFWGRVGVVNNKKAVKVTRKLF